MSAIATQQQSMSSAQENIGHLVPGPFNALGLKEQMEGLANINLAIHWISHGLQVPHHGYVAGGGFPDHSWLMARELTIIGDIPIYQLKYGYINHQFYGGECCFVADGS